MNMYNLVWVFLIRILMELLGICWVFKVKELERIFLIDFSDYFYGYFI